jgi:hypothetical protein
MNTQIIKEITDLSNDRYKLIDEKESTWNSEAEKYMCDAPEIDARIDEYAEKIGDLLFQYNLELPFEFVMEELSKLGDAPNLLYDDNGHWAVTSEGFQSVCSGDEPVDCELAFDVPASYWKDTVREALEDYLNR